MAQPDQPILPMRPLMLEFVRAQLRL